MAVIAIDTPTDAQLRQWHRVVVAACAHDQPDEPPLDFEQTRARLLVPKMASRTLLWAEPGPDGDLAGVAYLRLPDDPDRAGEIDIHVRPEHRRGGIGTRLLAAAGGALRAGGCRTVFAQVVAGTPAVPFLEGRGFHCVLTLQSMLLRMAEVDPLEVARRVAEGRPGYRLRRWTGTVPNELAGQLATAKIAMAEGEQFRWDAARVREMAGVVAARGDDLYTVAALHGPSAAPELAGFTEVVVPGAAPERAAQYDTAVVPEHRGRRLGIWLKAAMLDWLRAERPEVAEIETDNADDNASMLAVNRELGFRGQREYREYQADTADLP
ncbi:GNAT family N-acetyltransferase [Actinomadura craniellae]|uniref:GNAT family N-acetyltransferase n=1 Tax=Actinomadura craniellae TaxID=2231787 RepID=A0A365GWK0_9ACTN|nr:GNAT family N-acetyltransferase [Actinomadura craniellae]RAY11148.1 GNAT family N-acetyltransferase [Actinomadura craniellae]